MHFGQIFLGMWYESLIQLAQFISGAIGLTLAPEFKGGVIRNFKEDIDWDGYRAEALRYKVFLKENI